jgi:PiT family inorganic phosphate transporter
MSRSNRWFSHALVGAYAGAAVAKAGWTALIVSGWTKTLIFILLAPLLGMTLGLLISIGSMWLFRNSSPHKVDRWFRKLQLLSAALYSLGHGTNDAQ